PRRQLDAPSSHDVSRPEHYRCTLANGRPAPFGKESQGVDHGALRLFSSRHRNAADNFFRSSGIDRVKPTFCFYFIPADPQRVAASEFFPDLFKKPGKATTVFFASKIQERFILKRLDRLNGRAPPCGFARLRD